MFSAVAALVNQVWNGEPPRPDQGLAILQAQGAHLTAYLAGAHQLKERAFGNNIQLCSIINAKSGRCSENCAFCAQSSHHRTTAQTYPLKELEEIISVALQAEAEGAHCFGIVTSGSRISSRQELDTVLTAIKEIRGRCNIEPSVSLGLLDEETARQLADAGCLTYHHNLETARTFFPKICTTHAYDDDVATIKLAKAAGMKVCSGGILGLGETLEQRIELASTLHDLGVDSVPLNFLNPIAGTPLEHQACLSPLDCIRAIAMFRYFLPKTPIRICGGREHNLRDFQSWMFIAGASGTMVGNYLTTAGRDRNADIQMIKDAEVICDVC